MDDQTARENRKNNEPLSSHEKAALRNDIYKDLQLPATSGSIRFFPGGKKGWLPWTVAAAVLLTLISTIIYFSLIPGSKSHNNGKLYASAGISELRTGDGEMKRVTLGDGTVVVLNANSALRYRNTFSEGSSREVDIEGNAFFSVKKDRLNAPFVVHARSLAVTVLGTELNVNARSAEAEVSLASGKVKVEQPGNVDNVTYLEPGEKMKLDTAGQVFLKAKINPGLYSAWIKGEWNFHQTTLEEITALIREYYGAETIFKNPKGRRLRINAVLPVSSLQNLVSVVERTLQIKIAVLHNQLIVQ